MSYHRLWHTYLSFLKACGEAPPSSPMALPLPFLPSPFICGCWHYMQRRLLSKIHLLNNLSSRRGGKGCTPMLGWVAEKNPVPDVWHRLLPRRDFDKEKWALHLVLASCLVTETAWQIPVVERHGQGGPVATRAGFCRAFKASPMSHTKASILVLKILCYFLQKLKILVKYHQAGCGLKKYIYILIIPQLVWPILRAAHYYSVIVKHTYNSILCTLGMGVFSA